MKHSSLSFILVALLGLSAQAAETKTFVFVIEKDCDAKVDVKEVDFSDAENVLAGLIANPDKYGSLVNAEDAPPYSPGCKGSTKYSFTIRNEHDLRTLRDSTTLIDGLSVSYGKVGQPGAKWENTAAFQHHSVHAYLTMLGLIQRDL